MAASKNTILKKQAEYLRSIGFDVIPIKENKAPLVKTYGINKCKDWSTKATAIALVTNTSKRGDCAVMTIDVDVYQDSHLRKELQESIEDWFNDIGKNPICIHTASGGVTYPLWVPQVGAHGAEHWLLDEDGNTLIETRGAAVAGYFIVQGECVSKTTGELSEYEIHDFMDLIDIPELTRDQYINLRAYMRQSSHQDAMVGVRFEMQAGGSRVEKLRRTSQTVDEIITLMESIGWKLTSKNREQKYLKLAHPEMVDRNTNGVSATIDTVGHSLFIWSTNNDHVAPFKGQSSYSFDRVERIILNMSTKDYKAYIESQMGTTSEEIKEKIDLVEQKQKAETKKKQAERKVKCCIGVAHKHGLRYNRISSSIEMADGDIMTDHTSGDLWMEAMREYGEYFGKGSFEDIIQSQSASPSYDPIFEYGQRVYKKYKDIASQQAQTAILLNNINLQGIFDVDDKYYAGIADLIKRWMYQIGRSVINGGGEAYELCLVISGPQGCGKTTFFKALLPNELSGYVCGGPISGGKFKDKDEIMKTAHNLLWIDDEWTSLKKSDQDHIKGVLSRTHITERGAYQRHSKRAPRRCIYGGTTNDSTVINDATGNRRIIPIRVTSIDEKIRGFKSDIINRDLLLAEMISKALDLKDDWMILSDIELFALNILTQEAQARSKEFFLIQEHYKPADNGDEFRSLQVICDEINHKYHNIKVEDWAIRKALDLMVNEGTIIKSPCRIRKGVKGNSGKSQLSVKYLVTPRTITDVEKTKTDEKLPF